MGGDKSPLQQQDNIYGILVSNLDSNVNSTQISNFFSFCGKIISLSLREKDDSTEAVLFFENEASAKTALLLDNALINDKPMTVKTYSKEQQNIHKSEDIEAKKEIASGSEPNVYVKDIEEDNIVNRDTSNRSATATIASIIASGYILGVDALNKAKQFDNEKQISESVSTKTSNFKEQVAQLDRDYGISETASNTSRSLNEQWDQFDQQHKLSENAAAVTSSISDTVSGWGSAVANGISSVFQKPQVQETLSSVSEWTNNVGRSIGEYVQPATDSVSREFNDIKEMSANEIATKKKERGIDISEDEIEMDELGDDLLNNMDNNNNNIDNVSNISLEKQDN